METRTDGEGAVGGGGGLFEYIPHLLVLGVAIFCSFNVFFFFQHLENTSPTNNQKTNNVMTTLSASSIASKALLCPLDKSSFSNAHQVIVKHGHLVLDVVFENKILKGFVDVTAQVKDPNAQELVLDTRNLVIQQAFLLDNSEQKQELQLKLLEKSESHPDAFGTGLSITLPTKYNEQDIFTVRVYYETTTESEAIQWLSPEQTVGKKYPYLFTQGEAIHIRSMVPCQDTPAVKMTYSAKIRVPKPLVAVMSAIPLEQSSEADWNVFSFEQKIGIPSYLIALAVGALKSKQIGPRSRVWTEEEMLEKAAYEFAETESFIKAAESFLPPYQWGIYDLLLLPPSFPYGGMENSCLTFVTPTLLAGDRSLANVVAHEIAHSWSGNLATNSKWEDFWLNEGFTVYIERRIIARMSGEQYAEFDSQIGLIHLKEDVDFLTQSGNEKYTAMVPNLDNVDPDDSFSSVPYEKGFNFLYYLTGVVGGKQVFEKFLYHYFMKFSNKTVSTKGMKDFFLEYFADKVEKSKLDSIEWDKWYYSVGMPPVKNQFDDSLSKQVHELVKRWFDAKGNYQQASKKDIQQWSTNQKVYFLESLMEKQSEISHEFIGNLEKAYAFSSNQNSEIRFRWQNMCLKANYTDIFPQVVDFVTSQGRMKFVRPLYRSLFSSQNGKQLAIDTFKKNRHLYHSIASKMVARDLKIE